MKKVFGFLVLAFFTAFIMTFTGCKKDAEIPTLMTTAISAITTHSAESGGDVTSDGGAEVTARGICLSTSNSPTVVGTRTTDGAGPGSFTTSITGLTQNTTYYVRAYATNREGTAYGNEISFNVNQIVVPTLTTTSITEITLASAFSGGNITDNGGDVVTAVGLCWGTAPIPTTSNSKTDLVVSNIFSSYLNGLQPSTKYYVRAYATNSSGTGYGNELSFNTSANSSIIFNPDLTYGSVSDIDGNIYKTIQIGTQFWMAENLKTTKYKDGSSIPNVTDNTKWRNLTTDGYSWYNNDDLSYKTNFGALYNWYAVTDNRNICPTGWHVPASAEWNTLANYIGYNNNIDIRVKETGTAHWSEDYAGGTNESGFTALPGGIRDPFSDFQFVNIGYRGSWWSASSDDIRSISADFYSTQDTYDYLTFQSHLQAYKISGISVRCIKDN